MMSFSITVVCRWTFLAIGLEMLIRRSGVAPAFLIIMNATPDLAAPAEALAQGDPTVVVRAHHTDEGYIHLDAVDLTDKEIRYVCERVHKILIPT